MISIVGGGPVGNYLAYLLARKGHKVKVFEEHAAIGKPIQCTGITTGNLLDIVKLDEGFVVNKIDRIAVTSPNGRSLEFKFRNKNIIIDRQRFDRHFAELAESQEVKYFFKHKFIKNNKNTLFFRGKKEHKTDYLIGADGPYSQVAKSNGLFGKREFIYGIQAVVKMELDPTLVKTFLGYGGFGWIVPESHNKARVGITATRDVTEDFWRFMKDVIGDYKLLGWQSGMIPVYNPKIQTSKGDVFLIGDAATQVKALTHGGIVPGLIAAQEMSKSFRNYDRNWKKRIGFDLWLNLFLRKVMDEFSDKDYNKLVSLFSQQKIKKIIEKHDRDFPSKFIVELALKEPRLFMFIKHLFAAYGAL